ncbi:MAG: Nucleotidyl transferase [Candidatus Saganbacteria bacterium]|uniref:Nucleotidyl transferase n=1 Tax=Candidatus Saganbacteria bacterium TaxID=2575572 RepID=A0A833KZT0_UNCSA|nr:MAG: Nucleotidyl transferase [Candidatus Saganbacteria bacterium]
MKALIMAAGYGTRLEPLTLAVPKPMAPIINKPSMLLNLELLRRNGIREAAVNIHYHPEQITNYFKDGEPFGVKLTYSFEEKLLGTAGGVLQMAKLIGGIKETFVVLSSDALTDINLRNMVSFHKKKKALVTIGLSLVEDPSQFGVVICDENNKITAFIEKPGLKEAPSKLVNTGIYIFEPEILGMIPKDKFYDFGKELFPLLVSKGAQVFGYKMVEYWSDVGGIVPYLNANLDAMDGRVRLFMPGKKEAANFWIGKNCTIDKSAKFEGHVVIGDRVEIREGAYLKDTVVGDRCVLSSNAIVEESVIWSDSYISTRAKIKKSIIGNWCHIGEEVTIGNNSVISNRCQIRKRTVLAENTSLKPNEIL